MTVSWFTRPLRAGDTGRDVDFVRRKLGVGGPGTYDADTTRKVRGVQMAKKIKPTGEVDEQTAEAIGEKATAGLTPDWYARDLELWFQGEDVRNLASLLGFSDNDDRYTPDVEAAVRRLQSASGLEPSGLVDEDLARLIGE